MVRLPISGAEGPMPMRQVQRVDMATEVFQYDWRAEQLK